MIVVVGAGVVGLSCAVRLAEAGHPVRVVAREPPLATTSAVAGAVWFPYLVGPAERVVAWALRTYEELCRLAESAPESGVVLRQVRVVGRAPLAAPPWRDAVAGWGALAACELPPGTNEGWVMPAPVIEPPRYLPWLQARLARAGGVLEVVPAGVASLSEFHAVGAVVCCAGLGAANLAGDETLVAVRGQVVLVENPGVDHVLLDEDDPAAPTYVIPRRGDCVLGGTADPLPPGMAGAAALAPDPAVTAAILARAARLVPGLERARVLGVGVGLRPGRPRVRLEVETAAAMPPVIQCYGHGGAGYTLSWGCADEVRALVEALA